MNEGAPHPHEWQQMVVDPALSKVPGRTAPRKMGHGEFNGQGWGVDPTLKTSGSLDLTPENCVIWLCPPIFTSAQTIEERH